MHSSIRLAAMALFLLLGSCAPLGKTETHVSSLVHVYFVVCILLAVALLVVCFFLFRSCCAVKASHKTGGEIQKTLLVKEATFRTLFDTSHDALFVLRDTVFVDCNRAFEKSYGLSREEILGKTPFDFAPRLQSDGSNTRNIGLGHIILTMKGSPQTFPWCHLGEGDTLVDSLVTLNRIETNEGALILGTQRDLSKETLAQKKLSELNAVLQSVLNQAPFGIMVAQGEKEDWHVTLANDVMLRLTQMTPDIAESLGMESGSTVGWNSKPFSLHEENGEELPLADYPLIRLMSRDETMAGKRLQLKRPDNSTSTLTVYTDIIMDSEGQTRGGVIIFQDITDRSRTEAILVTAKEEANRANMTKNEFLANMSHELRTPLNAVLGMLQLLKRTKDQKERDEFIDIALKSGRSLLTILSDILDLAMIESGDFEVRDEGVNVSDLLLTVVESFELQANAKALKINFTTDESVPDWIVCDASRIRQILFNLVGNAVKFTENGEVHITASLLPNQTSSHLIRLYFSVQDSGIGISDAKMKCIFDPFIQADGSMTRAHGGAGLGLSIASRLISRLGGSISVESDEGVGTTFHFTVLAKYPYAIDAKPTMKTSPAPLAVNLSRSRVLLVEDDEDMQYLGTRFLSEYGVQCDVARDGEEALEKLQQSDFNLVLMDIQMPRMNGEEATRIIRSGEFPGIDREIPIVAMTAHAMRGDRERFLNTGMNDYIAKPIDEVDLVEILRRYAPKRS